MTVSFEHDVDRAKHAECLREGSFNSKIIVETHTPTYIRQIAQRGPLKHVRNEYRHTDITNYRLVSLF